MGPNVITDRTFITLGLKMLLRMRLLLRLGPNVITDGTFITLGSNYYTCAFYRPSDNNFGLRNFQRVSQQGARVPLLTEPVFKTSKPHEKTRWAGPAGVSHFPLHLLLRSPGKEFALAQLAREILPTGFQGDRVKKKIGEPRY